MDRICTACGAPNGEGAASCTACGRTFEISGTQPRFKRVPLLLMILWSMLTLGVYTGFWLYLRRDNFNKTAPPEKIEDWLAIATLVVSFFGIAEMSMDATPFILSITYLIIYTVTAFKLRNILRLYARQCDASRLAAGTVAASPVCTFFFTFFYIQYHINKLIDTGYIDRQ